MEHLVLLLPYMLRAGVCLVAQWQSTGSSSQVSWVYLPVTAFHFLLFCLITGKFTVKASQMSGDDIVCSN